MRATLYCFDSDIMPRSSSFSEQMRQMCLNDPTVQALYRNELNWCDIPEDDSPLELDNWKSYKSKSAITTATATVKKNAWLKRPSILPITYQTISVQTDSYPVKHISTQTNTTIELEDLQKLYILAFYAMIETIPTPTPPQSILPLSLSQSSISQPLAQLSPLKKDTPSKANPSSSSIKQKEIISKPKSIKTLYVGKLPPDATELELRTVFQKYGAIRHIALPKIMDTNDKKYGLLKGFALIQFQSEEAALRAFQKESPSFILRGKQRIVEFAQEDH